MKRKPALPPTAYFELVRTFDHHIVWAKPKSSSLDKPVRSSYRSWVKPTTFEEVTCHSEAPTPMTVDTMTWTFVLTIGGIIRIIGKATKHIKTVFHSVVVKIKLVGRTNFATFLPPSRAWVEGGWRWRVAVLLHHRENVRGKLSRYLLRFNLGSFGMLKLEEVRNRLIFSHDLVV